MYTHILVPVDGSPTSNRGLDEAVKVAKLTGARLRLIHVVDQFVYAMGMDGNGAMAADLIPLLREGGEQILKTCKAHVEASGVPVDTALFDSFDGRVCDLVVAEAMKWQADLIVLGTPRTPRRRTLLHGQRRRTDRSPRADTGAAGAGQRSSASGDGVGSEADVMSAARCVI